MKTKGEVLVKLRELQNDYYSRKNAIEAYSVIIDFRREHVLNTTVACEKMDYHLDRLKACVSLDDDKLFTEQFAHSLIKIMLCLKKNSFKETS